MWVESELNKKWVKSELNAISLFVYLDWKKMEPKSECKHEKEPSQIWFNPLY